MPEHILQDEHIHDLTMFVLSKLEFKHIAVDTPIADLTDASLQKYLEIYTHIKSSKKQITPFSAKI
jgi:hypothetical protein